MKEITYISCSSVPSSYANSVHVMKMCDAFAGKGLDVKLVCKKTNEWINEAETRKAYRCRNVFHLSAFSSKLKGRLFSISYIIYALRQVRRAKGLVYSRYFYPLVPLFFSRKPFILEFHNDLNRIDRFLTKHLIRKDSCKQLVFISKALKTFFIEHYNVNEAKCIVLPDACDIAGVESVDTSDVGYVGHLYKGRGIELLIEIAKRLPDLSFHIIGGKEPELSQYKAISPDNMIYYGSVKHADLEKYYSKFSIALAPYQEKIYAADKRCETSSFCSPMKLFEYMSFQKAIICSDLPVFHEVAEDGVDLLFRRCSDIDGWVDAITQLNNDTESRKKLVANSYKRFLQDYTWDGRVSHVLSSIM